MTVALGLAALVTGCGASPGDPPKPDGGRDADACVAPACIAHPGELADEVVEAPGQSNADFGDASLAVNGVRGCGDGCGSLDVFSLGYAAGEDNYLVLRWSGRRVTDGPGADLVVFENAFDRGGGDVFMDLLVVAVSRDGTSWVEFPHDYQHPDETVYVTDPARWPGFAGRTPVRLHEEENPVDPFDREAAGGDAFDLADLPAGDAEADAIRAEGFVYLRLETAPSRENPDTGAPYVHEGISNGADVDGVYARYVTPE